MSLPAGCGDPENPQAEIPGVYKQVQSPESGLQQIYTVELRPDFSASLSREYVKKGKVIESGTWTNDGRTVLLTLTQSVGVSSSTSQGTNSSSASKRRRKVRPNTNTVQTIEFKWRGTKITSTKWDENAYGTEGLGTFDKE